ncbi:tetratricopeptide repeat protein [Gemmatimonadota bacterium]
MSNRTKSTRWSPARLALPALSGLLILTGSLLGGCGNKGPTSVSEVEKLVKQGWVLFSSEEYTDALVKFDEALEILSQTPDAHHGRGWSLAYLGRFNEARNALVAAKELSLDDPDIWAGGAFIYSALGDQVQVVFWAETAFGVQEQVSQTTQWTFIRNTAITHIHLRLVLAKAYWTNGAYTQCINQLDTIEPGISHGGSAQVLFDDLARLTAQYGSPF